jgi:deoxyadenosine/deoxycytidine kinase
MRRVVQSPTSGGPSSSPANFSCCRTLSQLGCSTSPRCSALPQQSSRQRPCSSSSHSASSSFSSTSWSPRNNNLLELRGVGPVNAGLLLAKEITSVEKLHEIYCKEFQQDKEELLRFLSDIVGFRNPAHCRSVAEHLENLNLRISYPSSVKLAVEGNIGAGKSTFLDILQDSSLELQDLIEVVPEPVEEWQKVHNGTAEPINLLDRFYKEPERYAYTFQHYVLLTRMEKDRKARSSLKPLRVLERSIFSDRLVFVRAMHEAGFMGDLELRLYDSWFSMEIAQDQELTPDGFIYLKARPETCIKRLRGRNRSEEAGVDRAYLENLHDKHESWLQFGAKQIGNEVQTKAALQYDGSLKGQTVRLGELHADLLRSAPLSIRDNVVFLGPNSGNHTGEGKVLDVLSGVPALILDHEQDDILFDLDARMDYAKKVKDFSEYVGSLQAGASRQQLNLMAATNQGSKRDNLTVDQIDSLKHLISDYRRLLKVSNKQGAMPEGSLLAMEGQLDSLSRFGELKSNFAGFKTRQRALVV